MSSMGADSRHAQSGDSANRRPQRATRKLLDQRVTVQPGVDPDLARRCLYQFFETIDHGLLGASGAGDRVSLYRLPMSSANDKSARLQLICTQALHWAAFLLVMNIQRILNVSATGLAVLMLLALGTFTAGIHVLSWRVCLLGSSWRSAFPAVAWIEAFALMIVLISVAALGIGVVLWWHWHESPAQEA
jgi:hypothetical protein